MYLMDASAEHGYAVALDHEISFCGPEACSQGDNIRTKAVDRSENTQTLWNQTGHNVY
jgi:hypothetical protein